MQSGKRESIRITELKCIYNNLTKTLFFVFDRALEDLREILQQGATLSVTRQGEIDNTLASTGLLDAVHEKLAFDFVDKFSLCQRLEVADECQASALHKVGLDVDSSTRGGDEVSILPHVMMLLFIGFVTLFVIIGHHLRF